MNTSPNQKQLPVLHISEIQKQLKFFEDPQVYGMKLSYRLKGESVIHNLWFENRQIPYFISHGIGLAASWHEWKSTSPILPTNHLKTLERKPLIFPPIEATKESQPNQYQGKGITYTLRVLLWDSELEQLEFFDSIPPEALAFLEPLAEWLRISESLTDPKIEKAKESAVVLRDASLCICHSTGIKFAVALQTPKQLHFTINHPLASVENCRTLIKSYGDKGISLSRLDAEILAGILITLLRNHKLLAIRELGAVELNAKLQKDCSKHLLKTTIHFLYNLTSSVALPKFALTGDFRFDWQLLNYIRILKGEDPSVGTRKTIEEPTVKATFVNPAKVSQASQKQALYLLDGLIAAEPSHKLFLMRFKSYVKNWGTQSKSKHNELKESLEDTLPLSKEVEKLLDCLDNIQLANLDDEDLLTLSQEQTKAKSAAKELTLLERIKLQKKES